MKMHLLELAMIRMPGNRTIGLAAKKTHNREQVGICQPILLKFSPEARVKGHGYALSS
jgi:hypothetical protein